MKTWSRIIILIVVCAAIGLQPAAAGSHPSHEAEPTDLGFIQGVESAWIVWETEAPVQRLAIDGDVLWVGTYGGGLLRWDRVLGHQETFTVGDGLPGSDVSGIAMDGSGNLWVTLLDGSVVRSSNGSSFSNLTPPTPAGENAWAVTARSSNVWVGTLGGGVANRSGGGWTLHSHADGLPFDDIYAIGLEGDGKPWIGTMGYGIAAFQNSGWVSYDPPLTITKPLSPGEIIQNRAITDIVVDSTGVKWFATDGSGVVSLDPTNTEWTIYKTSNSGLCGNFVQSVHLDPEGNLWFGTLGDGVCRLNAERTSWKTYHSNNSPLPEDDVLDVVVDSVGGLWLAAYDAGLTYFGPLPTEAPDYQLDPLGEPGSTFTGTSGYTLWLDPDTYEWTLGWTGGDATHEFSGEILADGEITLLGTEGLEQDDEVNSNGGSLTIDAVEGSGWDRVTFSLERSIESIVVALQMDGAYYPYRIRVGGSGGRPGTAPFSLAAPQPQQPNVQVGDDITISEGSYAFLSGAYHDPDSPGGHSLTWDLGDGTEVFDTLSVSHPYADDGVYQVTLAVTDVHGLTDSASMNVTVQNISPEVDFFTEPFPPNIGEVVTFEAIIFDPGIEDTHSYTWDFGDGSKSTDGPYANHTYLEVDNYLVTLTVEDDDGGIGVASYILTVTGNNPPEMTLPDPLELSEGEAWSASVEFSDPDSEAWTASIDYGDGTDPVVLDLEEADPFELAHVYADNGAYEVTIVLTDEEGAPTEGSIEVTVSNVAPVLTTNALEAKDESESFTIDLASFIDPGFDCAQCGTEENFTATIDWGDGIIEPGEVEEIPGGPEVATTGIVRGTHVYPDNGIFTIMISLCDDDDGCGETQVDLTVQNLPPSVELVWDDVLEIGEGLFFLGRQGVEQSHSATATDPGTDDLTFAWSSGAFTTYYNNGVSPDPPKSPDGEHPFTASDSGTFVFDNPGVYAPSVEVTDDDGGVAEVEFSKLVTGDEACARSQGFWKHQFSGKGKAQIDEETLLRYLDIVETASGYFGEVILVDTLEDADEILNSKGSDRRVKAEAQLLAAWLNFAHGAVGWDEIIPLPDGNSLPFHDVIAEAEALLLDPDASDEDLVYAKDLAEAINLFHKNDGFCKQLVEDDEADEVDEDSDGDNDDLDEDDGNKKDKDIKK